MSRYDRSITVFSPDGHLLQVEYALEAVKKGAAVVGIKAKDAVILAVEKRAAAKLQDDRTLHKIVRLDQNIVLAFAGLSADARVLINKARIECQSHRLTMEDDPSPEYISRYIGTTQQKYTQRGGVRPFGLSVLTAGIDAKSKKPELWASDPSGVYASWKAHAIGRNNKTLQELLEKNYNKDCTCDEAVKLAISALMEVVENGAKSIELAIVKTQGLELVLEDKIAQIIAQIEAEKEEGDEAGHSTTSASGTA